MDPLTQQELDQIFQLFPDASFSRSSGLPVGNSFPSQLDSVSDIRRFLMDPGGYFLSGQYPDLDARLAAMASMTSGVRDLSARQLFARGVEDSMDDADMPEELNQSDYGPSHQKTYVPVKFRAKHHRIGPGRHCMLFMGKTVFEFPSKKAAAAACRSWNAFFAVVGQALPFVPSDVVQAFSDMIVGGSGDYGLQNEFSPPYKGRIDLVSVGANQNVGPSQGSY